MGYVPVLVENAEGAGDAMIMCDHATNEIPPEWRALGLDRAALDSHVAWDPGAYRTARILAERLDAPLVSAAVSRLLIDMNRAPDSSSLIVEVSETTAIPGNRGISPEERRRRIDLFHAPYHRALAATLDSLAERRRRDKAPPPALLALHSFTPVYHGKSRPWQIGLLFGEDDTLGAPMLAKLATEPDIVAGHNVPYGPADGVLYSLDRHAAERGLPHVMIEIRNDVIAGPEGCRHWAALLETAFRNAYPLSKQE
jgi:predicted N-formylglutamate amidohydrolase